MEAELVCDPHRGIEDIMESTGILVRAKKNNEWVNVDICELTYDSLMTWLKSRGGDNPLAERTVATILGHDLPVPPT